MSPISKTELVHGRRKCLVSCHGIHIALTELHEAEAIEFLGVWIDLFILVDDARHSDQRTRRNSDAIGKCEWTQCETIYHHWAEEVEY